MSETDDQTSPGRWNGETLSRRDRPSGLNTIDQTPRRVVPLMVDKAAVSLARAYGEGDTGEGKTIIAYLRKLPKAKGSNGTAVPSPTLAQTYADRLKSAVDGIGAIGRKTDESGGMNVHGSDEIEALSIGGLLRDIDRHFISRPETPAEVKAAMKTISDRLNAGLKQAFARCSEQGGSIIRQTR